MFPGGGNLTIFSRQSDVSRFYNEATIVLTLTNPRLAIETFGLTTLEAMTNALPVIVPTQGGIAELVEDGVNGFKTDVMQLDVIERQISLLLENHSCYLAMARSAHSCSKNYNDTQMCHRIETIVTKR